MLKKLLYLLLIVFVSNTINGQEKIVIENNDNYQFQSEKNKPTQTTTIQRSAPVFQPRWSYGGNIGMSFWNGGTDIYLGPKAYYHISPKFLTGIGVTYIYSDGSYWTNGIGGSRKYDYHSNSFGGSVSALYRPIPFLQFSAEYEGLQTEWRGVVDDSNET